MEGILERAQHQRERRPEFVTYVREKHSLCAIDLGRHLGSPTLFFVDLRAGERRCDCPLTRSMNRISVIVGTVRIEPRDEEADGLLLALRSYRNRHGRLWWLMPTPARHLAQTGGNGNTSLPIFQGSSAVNTRGAAG